MDWKSRIEALLAIDGFTVDSVASAMGVTGNAVREILSGRTKAPRAEAALALFDLCRQHGVGEAA